MEFPVSFICASHEYADYDRPVAAPYLRRKFECSDLPAKAEVLVSGLGFYRIFVNGREITKGILAPYISNPDDIVYYDRYDITGELHKGENVIGLMLGNGLQNCFGGYVWDFDKARWRGAPMAALRLDVEYGNGEKWSMESNGNFLTHPSPLLSDDLRSGEIYDARLESDGWSTPDFDDADWQPAMKATLPRGELRLCEAEPIVTSEALKPVSIVPYQDGYLYDFGVNTAGRIRLKVRGTAGQEISTFHGEWFHDGILDPNNINFKHYNDPRDVHVQCNRYICRGEGVETYAPYFAYYGFRYVYVRGITAEQATEELMTYEVMHSALEERGSFRCSDETINQLQRLTRRSTLSNFFYFPTDCPHREKNGWTGDAALSAEHTLLNLCAEHSYREWLRNVRAAQSERGSLPGIVPTGGWGTDSLNGPAWDSVLTYLPFYVWKYRGDTDIIRENASSIFRYLHYLTTCMDESGLIAVGLGDWCTPGRKDDDYKAPLVFTDSVISMDIARKAEKMFDAVGLDLQRDFARALADRLRAAIRSNLIDFADMTVIGTCQTAQAMGIYYDVFENGEKSKAFARLKEMIEDCGGHMDTGILGARVLFHVLSDFGETERAIHMITRPDYPSYGNWIARGATSLWEAFMPEGDSIYSQNHHFFGDISSWFIQVLGGIVLNPKATDLHRLDIKPHFAEPLTEAEARHRTPFGEISVHWKKNGSRALLKVEVPEEMHGNIVAPKGWTFDNGKACRPLTEGEFEFKEIHRLTNA